MSQKIRCYALLLVLVLTLGASAAEARPLGFRSAGPAGLFAALREWFGSLFERGPRGVVPVWGEEGCGMDPNGTAVCGH